MASTEVPQPKRGGTFLYCPWEVRAPGSVTTCAGGPPNGYGRPRFRTLKKFRRHWRQAHGQ